MSINRVFKIRNYLQYDCYTANLQTCFKDSMQKFHSPLITDIIYNRVIELVHRFFILTNIILQSWANPGL